MRHSVDHFSPTQRDGDQSVREWIEFNLATQIMKLKQSWCDSSHFHDYRIVVLDFIRGFVVFYSLPHLTQFKATNPSVNISSVWTAVRNI